MHSAIYTARVRHHRLSPKVHQFAYGVFYLWLDLDELETLSQSLRCFSYNRWGMFSFLDADHMRVGAQGAKANVLKYLGDQGQDTEAVASVRLLTFPRVLGYIFNPVCFYYCFDAHDQPLYAVAEVTNTFHEQKPYVLTTQDEPGRFRLVTEKFFYVSPFMALDLCFDFKLRVPGENLEIHVDDRRGDERVLLSMLTGQRMPLTDAGLLRCFFRYPLVTLRVIFLIHYHALKLWLKKLPFHRKGDNPENQRGIVSTVGH